VLTIVRFLHHILENKRGWVIRTIEKLTQGKSGLMTPDGVDVFRDKFNYLQESGLSPQDVYQDILSKVFHAPSPGGLHLCDIRGGTGEIGLKVGGADDYFGLIYIGDTSAFKKLVEEDGSGIVLEEDAISGSLFGNIAEPDATIEILIGAKKFMEGWNSWRVAAMGLLNIGRQEGSQIIQLFGRGVRLKGKSLSLKRSSALEGKHPAHIGLLETLNIFAVRANYMGQFREYLEKEGVETEEAVELPLFVRTNKEFLRKGLLVPRVPDDRNFAGSTAVVLEPDPTVQVRVDISTKVESIQSGPEGFVSTAGQIGRELTVPDEVLELVDWERTYLDLLEYKERKGFNNLIIRRDVPKQIMMHKTDKGTRLYRLVADETVIKPTSFAGKTLLQEAVINILRKYADDFYRIRREQWESRRMVYKVLTERDPNISFGREVKEGRPEYVVKVQRSKKELISAVQKLIADSEALYRKETEELPRIYFDRHLYQPLLMEYGNQVKMAPPGLNESEAQFVRDLKEYWAKEKDNSLAGFEVYLLRNLSRGSGIGFFEERGFYPDFILWIVNRKKQSIVFIEPHGMLHAKAYYYDEKARLHEVLPALEKEIAARSKTNKQIKLDSYIISATKYDDLCKKYDDGTWNRKKFAEKHILFLERNSKYDYLDKIFREQIRGGNQALL